MPLIVTHGWPGSIIEQLKIIEPLTDPTAHGASASDAFHLVIPSLPGHGFSPEPATLGWDPVRIAKAWLVLMERLGYDRFVAQGGDWGANVTQELALLAPARGDRNPHEHAGHRPGGHLGGGEVGREVAGGAFRRRAAGVRSTERFLRKASGLRGRNDQPAANALRAERLADRAWRRGCSTTTKTATR